MLASLDRTLLLIPRNVIGRFCSSSSYLQKQQRKFNNPNSSSRQQKQMNTVKPVAVKNPNPIDLERKRYEEDQQILRQYKRESLQNLREYGDIIEEPNVANISKVHDQYLKERRQFKDRLKRSRMMRKHFKDIIPKETNLLTWAEKENIRYLMETDPGQWTPETISQAYPISATGVEKVVKSGLRLKTPKAVLEHDRNLAEKIKRIKSGEIPMTDELAERLKMRDLAPIKVGNLGVNPNQFVDVKPRTDGEFARLVALTPPSLPKKSTVVVDVSENEQDSAAKYITDGSFYYNEGEINEKLKPGLTKEELRNILRSPSQKLTFTEFEKKMDRSRADSLAEDMKYMLNINKDNNNKNIIHHEETSERTNWLDYDDFDFRSSSGSMNDSTNVSSKVQKYKPRGEEDSIAVTVEGKEAFLYAPDTGYQKPYEPSKVDIREKIDIPEKLRQSGATYKVGDSFYDDEGNFLFRVI